MTAGEDWRGVYIMLIVSAVMTPYFRYLVMADKDYHYRLTTEGVIVTYLDAIPAVPYTIVRGVVWWYVCSLLQCWGHWPWWVPVVWRSWQYFFTDFKSELHQEFTLFYKEWPYTLTISKKHKELRFESTYKHIFGCTLYCKDDDIPTITAYLKEHVVVEGVKYIKGHSTI